MPTVILVTSQRSRHNQPTYNNYQSLINKTFWMIFPFQMIKPWHPIISYYISYYPLTKWCSTTHLHPVTFPPQRSKTGQQRQHRWCFRWGKTAQDVQQQLGIRSIFWILLWCRGAVTKHGGKWVKCGQIMKNKRFEHVWTNEMRREQNYKTWWARVQCGGWDSMTKRWQKGHVVGEQLLK